MATASRVPKKGSPPYRQGDVLLLPTSFRPKRQGMTLVREQPQYPDVEGLVLAAGEATGHHHVVQGGGRLYESAGQLYLRVPEEGDVVTLEHDEHDPMALEPGDYSVVTQREYEAPTRAAAAPRHRPVYD